MSGEIMNERRYWFVINQGKLEYVQDNVTKEKITVSELEDLLNEQQEFIEELQASDEMGWRRAEHFEKKCPKELHNKKMYIKRLEYKVQKFKEENEQLRQIMNDIVVATDETYTKNASVFKVTVVLDFEKYMEIRRCIE